MPKTKKPGVFNTQLTYADDKPIAHCVIMATGEQIKQMFYGIAENHSEVIPFVLNGIFDALDKEQPGFAELMRETISNFKPKSNE